jgi:hypothetical protein
MRAKLIDRNAQSCFEAALLVLFPQSSQNGSDYPCTLNSRLNICPTSALVNKAGLLYKDDFRIVIRIDVSLTP